MPPPHTIFITPNKSKHHSLVGVGPGSFHSICIVKRKTQQR
jgi:hypothetical protein